MEIKINISAEGLENAISLLANALSSSPIPKQASSDLGLEQTTVKEDKPKQEGKKGPAPFTFEQVRVKLAEVSQRGKQKELKALINEMGAEKLSDIPEEKYAALLEKAAML